MPIGKARILKNGYQKLRMGMKKQDVLALFGTSDSQRVHGAIEILTWWNREFKGFVRGGTIERRVVVEFENDKVIGFDGHNIDMSVW